MREHPEDPPLPSPFSGHVGWGIAIIVKERVVRIDPLAVGTAVSGAWSGVGRGIVPGADAVTRTRTRRRRKASGILALRLDGENSKSEPHQCSPCYRTARGTHDLALVELRPYQVCHPSCHRPIVVRWGGGACHRNVRVETLAVDGREHTADCHATRPSPAAEKPRRATLSQFNEIQRMGVPDTLLYTHKTIYRERESVQCAWTLVLLSIYFHSTEHVKPTHVYN